MCKRNTFLVFDKGAHAKHAEIARLSFAKKQTNHQTSLNFFSAQRFQLKFVVFRFERSMQTI